MRNKIAFNNYYRKKRLFDLVLLLLILPIVIPVFMILILLVYLFMGRPIIFKQLRPGLKGELFIIYKFRTMRNPDIGQSETKDSANRLTKFGELLRSTSLDELPELLNVILGNMSFVGPRPLLPQYLPLYDENQFRRHDVLPGITGWAQVNGRNAISWQDRFKLDVWYVDNWSLFLDFKILCITFLKIIKRESVSPKNGKIMSQFTGNDA